MSNPDNKQRREVVVPVAELIRSRLAPYCAQAVIAGSLRREKPLVGDIEIVCAYRTRAGLFDDAPDTESVERCLVLMQAERDGLIVPDTVVKRNGAKYKRFLIPQLDGMPLDLFLADADNFGSVLAIRTGAGAFSKRLMTSRAYGGCMPDGMCQKDGYLWRDGVKVPTPTEEDYFHELGQAWIHPRERTE